MAAPRYRPEAGQTTDSLHLFGDHRIPTRDISFLGNECECVASGVVVGCDACEREACNWIKPKKPAISAAGIVAAAAMAATTIWASTSPSLLRKMFFMAR